MVIGMDRRYVLARRRLLDLEAGGASVLEIGEVTREVRALEREIVESFDGPLEARDYLRDLEEVARGVAQFASGLWRSAA